MSGREPERPSAATFPTDGAVLDVAIVVGEHSGDQLGFKLMRAMRAALDGRVRFRGVAGPAMIAEGMTSLFPVEDIAVMGFTAVAARFRTLRARAWQVIDALVATPPDVLVIIDSPGFTHAVAKRVRRRLPNLPIVDYVSPSVWAWRPGRAPRMRAYVDHVLALLPFEPAAHARLGGPPCTYVGHPLIERLDELRPNGEEALAREAQPPLVLMLPGSRSGEIERLMAVFGEALVIAARRVGAFDVVLPAVSRQAERIRVLAASWPVEPRIVEGDEPKFAAFRRARAALAASGTVTLELALSGVPMVGAYRVSAIEAFIARRMIKVPSVLLPNLILGERAIPEFLQDQATSQNLGDALAALIEDGPVRRAQIAALARLDGLMRLDGDEPSACAARVILDVVAAKRQLQKH